MEICRLCLLNQKDCFNIFSNLIVNKNVAEIIGKHIGEVSETDLLPNAVCWTCWNKIENFHSFYEYIHEMQANFLSDLIKYENNFVDVLEPVHLNLDTVATDIEPVDSLNTSSELNNDLIKSEYDASYKNEYPTMFLNEVPDEISNVEDEAVESGYEKPEVNSDESQQSNSVECVGENLPEISITQKKVFTCDICQATLSAKQKLIYHMSRHIRYQCEICFESCSNRKTLEYHNKMRHGQENIVKARLQLEVLDQIALVIPNKNDVNRILNEHSEAVCSICSIDLPKSLTKIQNHYNEMHGVDGFLKCCSVKLTTIVEVHDHILSHLYSKNFVCEVCGKIGKDTDKFRRHISRHISELQELPHLCTVCHKGFKRAELLEVHQKYHHGIDNSDREDGKPKYTLADFFTMQCDLCNLNEVKFESFQMAKQHYAKEHGVVGYLICCDKKFVKPKTVDDHFKWHINPEYHKCPYCSKCFDEKLTFSTHVSKHKALEDKRFNCELCNKSFSSNYYLKTHQKIHNRTTKKSLSCQHCGKRYTSAKSLEAHITFIHENDGQSKGIICEFCGKQFISRASVLNHIQTLHRADTMSNDQNIILEKYDCAMCDASFVNKYRLKKHIDTIHLGEPVKCSFKNCNKVAPNKSALICHMRSVHVAQKFQCHLCSKTFKAAVALKDHIATHTGEKLYKCSFCPEAFIWRPNMYSHQKKAHPEEWKQRKRQDSNKNK